MAFLPDCKKANEQNLTFGVKFFNAACMGSVVSLHFSWRVNKRPWYSHCNRTHLHVKY